MGKFGFEVVKREKGSKARLGKVFTEHGSFETPTFVPVATQATIKALDSQDVENCGVDIFIANTYHLHLRPGENTIEKLGGLHGFMGWNKPIMTDSGGFQVFSLGFGMEHGVGKIANIFPDEDENFLEKKKEWGKQAKLAKINDDGVEFTSHLTGEKLVLTPRTSIQMQKKLGGDIVMAFDECTSPLSDYKYTKRAMLRTHKWAEICVDEKNKGEGRGGRQALFGSIQGGAYEDLRVESSKFIGGLPVDGFAIGGSLGRSKKDMHKVLDWVIPLLPEDKPRHLLGIGEVEDIFNVVEKGVDTFDCVMPTRLGRMGQVLIQNKRTKFRIDISKSEFSLDKGPIQKGCNCFTCQNYSRAYVSHLFRTKELLGYRLATIHNLYFMSDLVKRIRDSIVDSSFKSLKDIWLG